MDRCGKWTSSYRLVLGLLEEIADDPVFLEKALFLTPGASASEVTEDALWDVIFVRLSALQEYGWHAGLEPLIWASDAVNGALAEMDWPGLQRQFAGLRDGWTDLIISHAKQHDAFFPQQEQVEEDDE